MGIEHAKLAVFAVVGFSCNVLALMTLCEGLEGIFEENRLDIIVSQLDIWNSEWIALYCCYYRKIKLFIFLCGDILLMTSWSSNLWLQTSNKQLSGSETRNINLNTWQIENSCLIMKKIKACEEGGGTVGKSSFIAIVTCYNGVISSTRRLITPCRRYGLPIWTWDNSK